MGDTRISIRLSNADRERLEEWAARAVEAHPAARGKLFRINGEPKISAIIKDAALRQSKEEVR